MGVTSDLAAFTAAIQLGHLPPGVAARAHLLVLDLVGSIVRARHDAESTAPMLSAARALGVAAGSSGVFGDCARYTPAGAALLNGALGHSLDFDDTPTDVDFEAQLCKICREIDVLRDAAVGASKSHC